MSVVHRTTRTDTSDRVTWCAVGMQISLGIALHPVFQSASGRLQV